MASSPKPVFLLLLLILCLFFSSSSSSTLQLKKKQKSHPCKELILYIHDIIYNGSNIDNATSAIVASTQPSLNLTASGPQLHFGDTIAFDDPITLDNNLHSTPVGRAQGIYVYVDNIAFTAWFGFTFSLNSTAYKGTINFVGIDPFSIKTRDISVVGGTGDFFMHRGIATMVTETVQGNSYFCVRLHTKFYDCW